MCAPLIGVLGSHVNQSQRQACGRGPVLTRSEDGQRPPVAAERAANARLWWRADQHPHAEAGRAVEATDT